MKRKVNMANLLDNVENSIWHAFDCLALEGDGTASKTKLKSLVSSIGKVLDLEDVDKGLDDYRSTNSISFEQFRFYLFKEVFSALPDEMSSSDLHGHEASIDEVCWSVCSSNYLERDNPVFPDDCVAKLFRVFCMLGDLAEDDNGQLEVIMAAGEVENAAYQFMMSLGRGAEWDPEEFDAVASVIPAFKLGIFVTVLESKYARDVDDGGIREAVRDVHDLYLLDVIKKGHLGKKMDLLPAFREHFFVLQPNALTFYAGSSQKEKRGELKIDGQCRCESVPDAATKSPLKKPGSKSHSRFLLYANEKTYEFQAQDHRTRAQWLKAFATAFDHSSIGQQKHQRYQRLLLEQRRIAREEEKDREEEEMLRTTDLGAQLETEKLARVSAEEKAETLARQRAVEGEKMKELEKIRSQLEVLLEEERQAKKDEEIVRTLQARILNEEWARRETLERLQEEQRAMLESERKKREEFERMQQDKEQALRDAHLRVEEMEKERRKLDKQLDLAHEKTRKANIGQEVLEAKIKVKEQESIHKSNKEAASRVTSLNPSASFYVRGNASSSSNTNVAASSTNGTGRYMPMRSASMRETSYSRSIRRSRQRTNNNNNGGVMGNVLTAGDAAMRSVSASNRSSVSNLALEENPVAATVAE